MSILLVFRGGKLKFSVRKYVSHCEIKICFIVFSQIPNENDHISIR